MDMFKKLATQLKKDIRKAQNGVVSLPMGDEFMTPKNIFFQKMSEKALELYERQADIDKFTPLVLSDLENCSQNDIMSELFEKGVIDPFEDDKLAELADNKRFLRDLGLL